MRTSIEMAVAHLMGAKREDLAEMRPIDLQNFGELCRHWARAAEKRRLELASQPLDKWPKAGVLPTGRTPAA